MQVSERARTCVLDLPVNLGKNKARSAIVWNFPAPQERLLTCFIDSGPIRLCTGFTNKICVCKSSREMAPLPHENDNNDALDVPPTYPPAANSTRTPPDSLHAPNRRIDHKPQQRQHDLSGSKHSNLTHTIINRCDLNCTAKVNDKYSKTDRDSSGASTHLHPHQQPPSHSTHPKSSTAPSSSIPRVHSSPSPGRKRDPAHQCRRRCRL